MVRFKSHFKGYESTRRSVSIRQISAYTESDCAANVLSGNIPINLAIKRAAEVRKAFGEGWDAQQIKGIYEKSIVE